MKKKEEKPTTSMPKASKQPEERHVYGVEDGVITNENGRRSYTVSFKKHVVEFYQKHKSKSRCAREFRVSRRCVSLWIGQSEDLFSNRLAPDARRVGSRDKTIKSQYPDLEKQVYEWIVSERMAKRPVTVPQIQERMMEMVYTSGAHKVAPTTTEEGEVVMPPTVTRPFVASRGWVYRFMSRFGLIQRNLSNNGKNFSTNLPGDVDAFLKQFRQIVATKDYKDNEILNFAETSFYIDCPENKSPDRKKKLRLSVLMSASCAGYKLPLICCIPRILQIADACFPQCVVDTYETEGTFSSRAIIENFFQRVLKAHMSLFNLKKVLLILDQMRTHMSESFKQAARAMNVELIYVPDGLSNILQPANVVWFKNLKPEYRASWQEWYANAPKDINGTDIKGATYAEMVEWISDGWDKLSRDVIKKSFKSTGFMSQDVALYHPVLRDIMTGIKMPVANAVVPATDEDDRLPGAFMCDETSEVIDRPTGSKPGTSSNITVDFQAASNSTREDDAISIDDDDDDTNSTDEEVGFRPFPAHVHHHQQHAGQVSSSIANNHGLNAPYVYTREMYAQAENHLLNNIEYPPPARHAHHHQYY